MDTNALMMAVELDVSPFDEIERLLGAADLVVPRTVLAELDRLSEGNGSEAAAARVGQKLADQYCRPIETAEGSADAEIARLATNDDVEFVVTNDTPLRRQVLDAGIPVISLRGRTKLGIIRP